MRTFALTGPAAIAKLPLLQQSTRPEGWRQWFDAQTFLLGAEFTKVYANAHGSVAGAKALAATKASAAAARAGTDAPGSALPAPARRQRKQMRRSRENRRTLATP